MTNTTKFITYEATPTEHLVIEEVPGNEDGRVVATCRMAVDAERIARLLNQEGE